MMTITAIGSQGQSWVHPVIAGLAAAAFIAFMVRMVRGQMQAVEKRLRLNRPSGAAIDTAEAVALPAQRSTAVLHRGDVIWALWKGGLNGAILGAGTGVAIQFLPLRMPTWLRWTTFTVVLSEAVLAGAVLAVLIRLCVRRFGPIPWVPASILTAIAVVAGMDESVVREALHRQAYLAWAWPTVLGVLYWDWATRHNLKTARRLERSGELLPDKVRLVEGLVSDWLIKAVPSILMLAGAVAGHFPGAALGAALAAAQYTSFGAALGGLIGRLTGGLLGGLFTVAVLRLYRVEDDSPWPGHAGRPYPRLLAALYLAVALGLFVVLLAL